jgi:hypothetical protein
VNRRDHRAGDLAVIEGVSHRLEATFNRLPLKSVAICITEQLCDLRSRSRSEAPVFASQQWHTRELGPSVVTTQAKATAVFGQAKHLEGVHTKRRHRRLAADKHGDTSPVEAIGMD